MLYRSSSIDVYIHYIYMREREREIEGGIIWDLGRMENQMDTNMETGVIC